MNLDETAELPAVQPVPQAITAASEESEAEALVADLADRVAGVRRLAPSRANRDACDALREELTRMVATALQLDAHLAEADRAEHDAATNTQFNDWATAPGGLQ